MVRIITILFIALVCCSCSKKINSTSSVVVKDSTYEKLIIRHDTITLPADSVIIHHYLECDKGKVKPFIMRAKSHGLTAQASVDAKGDLEVKCLEDSLKKVIDVMDKEIFHLRHEKEVHNTTIEVSHVPKIYTYALIFSISVIVGLLVYLYLKLKPF